MVRAQSLFIVLKTLMPAYRIEVLAPAWTPLLLARILEVFNAVVVILQMDCSPCFKRDCPLCPVGHNDYPRRLTGIRPDRALELINGATDPESTCALP